MILPKKLAVQHFFAQILIEIKMRERVRYFSQLDGRLNFVIDLVKILISLILLNINQKHTLHWKVISKDKIATQSWRVLFVLDFHSIENHGGYQ